MKEALFYIKKGKNIQCKLCPRHCLIKPDRLGICHVRKNVNGKLYSLVYGKVTSASVDPIEKKPLYHFLPGTNSFSIGTVGCNLSCKHCQNYSTSQAEPGDYPDHDMMPDKVVSNAVKARCNSISYTYNEPTIFYEFMKDTAKIAKKQDLRNIIVSNGFIEKTPLNQLCKLIDGANIDLKTFDDKFYREITSAWLDPVLESLKILHKKKVWLEITNLIIPTLNDNLEKIKGMCEWIKNNLSVDVPLHFTAFYPTYKLTDIEPTSAEILFKARNIAKKVGLNYVYIGNIQSGEANNTYCPKCNELLIERNGFHVIQNNIKDGKCSCGENIAGVWQ